MPEVTNIADTYPTPAPPAVLRRISWGAIFAGVVVVIAVQLLLNMLGLGIGASTIDPAQGDRPGRGFAIGAGIWVALTSLIALFLGGWTAGRLAGIPNRKDGMLHGFTTWSLATLVMFYLLTTAVGGLIGGAASVIGRSASAAARTAGESSAVAGIVQRQTGMNPEQIQQEAGDVASDPRFVTFVQGITRDGRVEANDRQALVQLVADKKGVSTAQADDTVSRWEQQMMQAREQAKQYADVAARNVSRAALATFFLLLIGGAAGTLGGGAGAPRAEIVPAAAARETRRVA